MHIFKYIVVSAYTLGFLLYASCGSTENRKTPDRVHSKIQGTQAEKSATTDLPNTIIQNQQASANANANANANGVISRGSGNTNFSFGLTSLQPRLNQPAQLQGLSLQDLPSQREIQEEVQQLLDMIEAVDPAKIQAAIEEAVTSPEVIQVLQEIEEAVNGQQLQSIGAGMLERLQAPMITGSGEMESIYPSASSNVWVYQSLNMNWLLGSLNKEIDRNLRASIVDMKQSRPGSTIDQNNPLKITIPFAYHQSDPIFSFDIQRIEFTIAPIHLDWDSTNRKIVTSQLEIKTKIIGQTKRESISNECAGTILGNCWIWLPKTYTHRRYFHVALRVKMPKIFIDLHQTPEGKINALLSQEGGTPEPPGRFHYLSGNEVAQIGVRIDDSVFNAVYQATRFISFFLTLGTITDHIESRMAISIQQALTSGFDSINANIRPAINQQFSELTTSMGANTKIKLVTSESGYLVGVEKSMISAQRDKCGRAVTQRNLNPFPRRQDHFALDPRYNLAAIFSTKSIDSMIQSKALAGELCLTSGVVQMVPRSFGTVTKQGQDQRSVHAVTSMYFDLIIRPLTRNPLEANFLSDITRRTTSSDSQEAQTQIYNILGRQQPSSPRRTLIDVCRDELSTPLNPVFCQTHLIQIRHTYTTDGNGKPIVVLAEPIFQVIDQYATPSSLLGTTGVSPESILQEINDNIAEKIRTEYLDTVRSGGLTPLVAIGVPDDLIRKGNQMVDFQSKKAGLISFGMRDDDFSYMDPPLRACVLKQVSGWCVLASQGQCILRTDGKDADQVTSLICPNRGIKNIYHLSILKNLHTINLSGNSDINDLSELMTLTRHHRNNFRLNLQGLDNLPCDHLKQLQWMNRRSRSVFPTKCLDLSGLVPILRFFSD